MNPEQICQNCTYFLLDSDDEPDFGACLMDIAFEDVLTQIWENGDFSCCRELYKTKRIKGDREACSEFELFNVEPLETPVGKEVDLCAEAVVERIRTADVSGIVSFFYDSDLAIVKRAIRTIEKYVYLDNQQAFENLLNYYLSLGPAENLEEVHLRVEIVNILAARACKPEVARALVNELERSPSNNTTRQLYTLILDLLRSGYDGELVHALLIDLVNKRDYSPKIKQRIVDLAWYVITPRGYGPF